MAKDSKRVADTSTTLTQTFEPPKELGSFELAVITFIIKRTHPELAPLLTTVRLVETDYNGHGMYFYTTSKKFASPLANPQPIDGPRIATPQLELGAGTVLYFQDNEINCLEVYGYGETFPTKVEEWTLHIDP